MSRNRKTQRWITSTVVLFITTCAALGVIRDGGIDPANLGKGSWIYFMSAATNKLGGNVNNVTNEASLMTYYKSQGIRYVIVKAATSGNLFNGSYATPQFTTNLVNIAHTNGILIFGYNRSYGSNLAAEVGISDYVFHCGADGFVWDAEAEWETGGGQPWITNGPAQAWQLCSTVRSNWPNKFLAHAPFPIIYLHSSFPYKEFGYWCDAVMPQIYHFSSAAIQGSPSAAINWSDVNWRTWQNGLASLPAGNSNGLSVYWTNAIKPIIPLQDVYGPLYASPHPNEDVMEFIDYAVADPNAQTPGGYQGVNFWRADLHGAVQWAHIKTGTSGSFSGNVNNIVVDDARATFVGGWTHVRVFGATPTLPTYYGATGSDTNSFGTNYFSISQGAGAAYAEFRPNILVPGDYDVYQWHPYVTNASAGTPFQIEHALGTTTVRANQQINAGNWSSLGRFNFASGTNGHIRVRDDFSDAGKLALADGIKLIFAASNLPAAATILSHPTDFTAPAGQSAPFTVTATGAPPLVYQWFFNAGIISGATNSIYDRTNVQAADAGNYYVTVSNALGAVTSSNATLTVNYSLTTVVIGGGSVARNPNQSFFLPGASVTLTANPNPGYTFVSWGGNAAGSANPLPALLQSNLTVTATFWSTNGDLFLDNTNAEVTFSSEWSTGSTSADKYLADYRFASTAAGGTATAVYRPALGVAGFYDVFVWYPQGSNRATNVPWSVVYSGGSTNIAVDQTVNGGDWRLIAAARPFAPGTNGFVQLSNDTGAAGKVVLADGVRFLIVTPLNTPPTISAHPQNQTGKVGSNFTFTVTATGFPPPTYQWRFNNNPIPGASSTSFVRSSTQFADAGNYSVVVSNSVDYLVSSNAVLTVLPLASLWMQTLAGLPDGRISLVVTGEPGYPFWVERSSDFSLWQAFTNLPNPTGTATFTDASASNRNAGFYRARH